MSPKVSCTGVYSSPIVQVPSWPPTLTSEVCPTPTNVHKLAAINSVEKPTIIAQNEIKLWMDEL